MCMIESLYKYLNTAFNNHFKTLRTFVPNQYKNKSNILHPFTEQTTLVYELIIVETKIKIKFNVPVPAVQDNVHCDTCIRMRKTIAKNVFQTPCKNYKDIGKYCKRKTKAINTG